MEELFGEYSKFTQKFIEVWDEYTGIVSEMRELSESGESIPEELEAERKLYWVKVEKMILEGYNRWQKSSMEMRRDGWDFWTKEDWILREQRYGGGRWA